MPGMALERTRLLLDLFGRCLGQDAAGRDAVLAGIDDPGLRRALARMLDADGADGALDAGAPGLVRPQDLAATRQDDDALPRGSRLGPWRLDRVLGRGGMGTVYQAHRDDGSGQRAAVKHLHRRWSGGPQADRFAQEQRILAALSHPGLPRLIDHGRDHEQRPWLALEFVDGQPLVHWADARRLGLRERVDLFRRVCAAVQHAHERFVVHRDLKPANILVDPDGHPKVLDFGVAKRTDDALDRTGTGLMAGFTPEYAAPEQVTGGVISAATDVYALGVLLYELLCGQRPYRLDPHNVREAAETITTRAGVQLEKAIAAGTPEATARRLADRGTDARAFRRFVRGDLSRIVQTALAKEPERRYASVRAFSDDLGRLLDGRPVSVAGDTLGYRAGKFVRRNRWGVAAAGVAVLAVVLGGVALAWQAGRAQREALLANQMKDAVVGLLQQADYGEDNAVALSMLKRGIRQLDQFPRGHPVRTELADLISSLLARRGATRTATDVIERELGPAIDGRRIRDTHRLGMLRTWATIQMGRGNVALARTALEGSLRSEPPQAPLEAARTYRLLAQIEQSSGSPERALQLGYRVLSLVEEGRASVAELSYSRANLAAALVANRKAQEGRRMSELALEGYPAHDPDRVYFMVMAALRRSLLGEFAAADRLYVAADRLTHRLGLADQSSFTLQSYAVNCYDLGELDRAERLSARLATALSAREELSTPGDFVGDSEPHWLRGEIALARNSPEDAAAAFGRALRMLSPVADRYPRQVTYDAALQAVALLDLGRERAAARLLRYAGGHARRADVRGSYAEAMVHAAQGRVLAHHGRHAQAVAAYDRALATLQAGRTRPLILEFQLKENRDALRFRVWKAQALAAGGDASATDRALADARRFGTATLGARHPLMQGLQGLEPPRGTLAAGR